MAKPLVWIFNLEGSLDLVAAITLATIYDAARFMGAAYWIPALWVPALLVTHFLTFTLLRRPRPGARPAQALFDAPLLTDEDLPELPALTASERLSWDYETHRAARRHSVTLLRRELMGLEIRPIETCYRLGRTVRLRWGGAPPVVIVASLSILRQRPPTAKGALFLTLEDETGMIQCVIRPQVLAYLDHVLRAGALIVRGRLHVAGNWRGLVVTGAWRLDGIFGGYEGHPFEAGGRDQWIRRVEEHRG